MLDRECREHKVYLRLMQMIPGLEEHLINGEYVLLKRWWWYWCMLCYVYMESDPKPKESRHCH